MSEIRSPEFKGLMLITTPFFFPLLSSQNAIPQYPVGHGEMINDITSDVDKAALPLMLLGPSYHNPGANHCLHRAKVNLLSILRSFLVMPCFCFKDSGCLTGNFNYQSSCKQKERTYNTELSTLH